MQRDKAGSIEEGYVFVKGEWRKVTNAWTNHNHNGQTRTLMLKPLYADYRPEPFIIGPESKLYVRETEPEDFLSKYSD